MKKPLFITHITKMAFAEEVFKRADEEIDIIPPTNANKMNEQCVERFLTKYKKSGVYHSFLGL